MCLACLADGPWICAFHEFAALDNAFILACASCCAAACAWQTHAIPYAWCLSAPVPGQVSIPHLLVPGLVVGLLSHRRFRRFLVLYRVAAGWGALRWPSVAIRLALEWPIIVGNTSLALRKLSLPRLCIDGISDCVVINRSCTSTVANGRSGFAT